MAVRTVFISLTLIYTYKLGLRRNGSNQHDTFDYTRGLEDVLSVWREPTRAPIGCLPICTSCRPYAQIITSPQRKTSTLYEHLLRIQEEFLVCARPGSAANAGYLALVEGPETWTICVRVVLVAVPVR